MLRPTYFGMDLPCAEQAEGRLPTDRFMLFIGGYHMITLYTSIGHYRLVSGKNNVSYPVITANGKEHRLDTKELLLWSSLMWNLLTFDELKSLYGEKEAEASSPG